MNWLEIHEDHDDGEPIRPECPYCQEWFVQSALQAGIPHSVIEGKTKLTDHFSPEYIRAQCYPKGEE